MPFVPVPNTAAIVLRQIWNSQQVVNTLYFHQTGAWNAITLSNLASTVMTWWDTHIQPLVSNTIALVEVSATDLTTATSTAVDFPVSPPLIGAASVNSVPNNCSIALTFKTGSRGRSFRGRNYVAGIPGTQVANNIVDGGLIEDLITAYELHISETGPDTGSEWVVVSRFSGVDADGKPIPRTTGLFTPIISVGVFDQIVDSQRRRLPGRGL